MRQLEATVCVPWRPSPSRLAPYARVRKFWERTSWPIVTADSDTEIFSLAQARNNAVKKATTEIVIICDADTIPVMANVRKAVADPVGVCWPFTRVRILSARYLDTPFGQLGQAPIINGWDGAGVTRNGGGCLVCTQTEFWRLGGQPPEFIGWGWEATAFTYVVETLSIARRIPGNVYVFEHNITNTGKYLGAKADSPGWDRDTERNRMLCTDYQNASGRPQLMRELLRRRFTDEN